MDGVLCDFDKAFANSSLTNITIEEFNLLNKSEKDAIKNNLFTYDFFYTMEPIAKGMALFEIAKQVYSEIFILTAHGDNGDINEICKAKRDWVRKHLKNFDRVHFVRKAEQKYTYLKHFNLEATQVTLIDDREKAINPWVLAGGVGILFKDDK